MSDNKRIAKNTIFLYIRMLLIMGVSLYTSRVVLQIFGVEDFGLYNVVGGIVTMFTFLNGSLAGATSRFLTFELGKRNYNRLRQVFNAALVIHVFIALIIILLAETIGLWFFYEKMTIPAERLHAAFWVYQISIATTLFSLTQVPYNAAIIAHENMKVYAYVGIIEVLAKLLIVYLLAISPIDKLIFYSLLLFAVSVGIMFYYRIYCMNHYAESHFLVCKDKTLYREMFGYAGSDMIGNIAVLAQGQGLNLLLNIFFGPVVNAARAIAYQVQAAITQFSNNFMTAVRPQIIKLYAEGKVEEMMSLVKNSSCFSFYLMWIISFPVCLEANYILSLWLGEFPDHTITFLHLIIILCLIQTLKTPRTIVFHATGHLKLTNMVVGGILCMAFPLAYIFLKMGWKAESVFWAANITMLLSEVGSVIILKRYINYSIKSYMRTVHGRCLLITAISFVLPYLLYEKIGDESFLRVITTGLLTSLSIAITVYFWGLNKEMRLKIINIIRTRICWKKTQR